MKKTLILVLALVLAISCGLLVACKENVAEIKFKTETVPTEVTRGTTIDYSKIKIVATTESGKTNELSLTDKNVTFTAIDVKTTGAKTLTANYGGKSAQAVITVVELDVDDYTVTGFENTDGYKAYTEAKKEMSNKETEFVYRDAPYTVGSANGYVCVPKTTAVADADSTDAVINTKVKTTYKLSLKNGSTYTELSGTDLTGYLSNVENNTYYFTETANGKEFKLEITLDDSYATLLSADKKTVTQEIKVTDGYNVYDALGMSVLDNLNNKSWANIKQTKLAWDNGKSLAEFNSVTNVIIHNNITVKKSDLPANYFWTEGEAALNSGSPSYADALGMSPTALKHLLKGSLKEVYLGEDWENGSRNDQRGLYTNDGISLYGNYLTLSYEAGYTVNSSNGEVSAPNGGIYVVNDYNQKAGEESKKIYPEAHWNFIAYRCKTNEARKHTASIENVYFVGQTQKTENTNIPCGLGMTSSELETLTVNNTIGNQWYFNFNIDENTAQLRMDGCKFFDSFSQMLFTWYGKGMNVTNSTLKRAGGPLIILQTPSYASGSSGALADGRNNAVDFKIDSSNNLENWLTGQEVWFKINAEGADALIAQMFGLNDLLDATPFNKHYVKKEGDMTMYNALMVLIPAPGDIFDNQKHLAGSITIGENVYSMDDPILNLRDTAQRLADLGNAVKTAFGSQLDGNSTAALDQLIAGATGLKNNSALLPLTVAPLYKSGNNYAYNDTTKLFVVPDVVKGLVQLSGGAQQVVGVLQGKLTEVNAGIAQTEQAGGDATQLKAMAAQLQEMINQWQAWITSVKPMTDLAAGIDITSSNADNAILAKWAQNWSTSEDYAALWVNPGGLSNPANMTYNYFMIIFAENPDAAPAA